MAVRVVADADQWSVKRLLQLPWAGGGDVATMPCFGKTNSPRLIEALAAFIQNWLRRVLRLGHRIWCLLLGWLKQIVCTTIARYQPRAFERWWPLIANGRLRRIIRWQGWDELELAQSALIASSLKGMGMRKQDDWILWLRLHELCGQKISKLFFSSLPKVKNSVCIIGDSDNVTKVCYIS